RTGLPDRTSVGVRVCCADAAMQTATAVHRAGSRGGTPATFADRPGLRSSWQNAPTLEGDAAGPGRHRFVIPPSVPRQKISIFASNCDLPNLAQHVTAGRAT